MKTIKWVLGLAFVAIITIGVWGCTAVEAKEAYLTIDINPSIDLTVNNRDKVIDAGALNEDGEILLGELDLIGKSYDDAIELIIDKAVDLGFIDVEAAETFVSVSSISENAEFGETVRTKVMNKVNSAFQERGMMGKALQKAAPESTVAEAGQYGVAPEKLNLAKRVCELDDTLALEDAVQMTTEQLMTRMQTRKQENKTVNQALREDFFAARQLIWDEYMPQIQALQEQIAALAATSSDVAALQAELETIRTAFRTEMQALRDQYHSDSEAERTRLRTEAQNRVTEHAQTVAAFRAQASSRRQTMGAAIRQFQSGSQNTMSTSGSTSASNSSGSGNGN